MVHGTLRGAAPAAAALAALLATAPQPSAALADLAGAAAGSDPTGPLVAVVSLAAWALAAWLALVAVVVLLSRIPGLLGRTARAVGRRVAPATVRRAVEAALGLTIAVGTLAPTAALAAPVLGPARLPAVSSSEPAWDLDWPSSTGQPPTGAARPRTAAPSSPGSSSAVTPADRPADPTRASAPAPSLVPRPVVRASPVAPAAAVVVVRPGDTLWSIAAGALRRAGTPAPTDRQIAEAWPRWWAANRDAVGDDPDLLLPGTALRPPSATSS